MAVDPQRSKNMSAIRSKDTAIEVRARRALHAAGFRFRLHRKDLAGKPDLVFVRYKTVAFVHGCFWHGHACADGRTPKSNVEYWQPKIAGNRARDQRNQEILRDAGWRVFVLRECTIEQDIARLTGLLSDQRSKSAGKSVMSASRA